MPDLDLEPGGYRERKPRGWRWKLPWGHPEDSKLHLVVFLVMVGFGVYFFLNRHSMSVEHVFGSGALFGALAGANLMLLLRD